MNKNVHIKTPILNHPIIFYAKLYYKCFTILSDERRFVSARIFLSRFYRWLKVQLNGLMPARVMAL